LKKMDSDTLGWAAEMACLLEVSADKPGNVTRNKEFNDTSFQDFIISAAAIGPAFRSAASVSVGETILSAIRATRAFVGSNTNLGIVLLLAPLAKAAGPDSSNNLQAAVKPILENLTVEDARKAYEAINLAKPAGMGTSEQHDLSDVKVEITLLQAMEEARERDSLAAEYVSDYNITFGIGLPALRRTLNQGVNLPEAIVQTFLSILSEVPDTLIARKKGITTAQDVSNQASQIIKNGGIFGDKKEIQKFDCALRDDKHSLNPGTTADLIAAVLFAYLIEDNFPLLPKEQ
jgi:triphosphoribosyl-dephospho-CoA synthase